MALSPTRLSPARLGSRRVGDRRDRALGGVARHVPANRLSLSLLKLGEPLRHDWELARASGATA
jgi:hypothetical protein